MSPGSAPASSTVNTPFDRRQWLVILAATLLAAGLRLWHVGEWALWLDEAHTWRDATMALSGEGGFLSSQRALYPLTFLTLRFLFGIGVLGFDEGSLRLPFVIIGVLTVPILAVCGRRLVGTWPAVVAACLLAINPWHLFWSQNARGYALVVLASVLAIHRAHVLFGTERVRDLLLTLVFLLLAVMSHSTAIFLVVGFGGFAVVRFALRPQARFGRITIGLAVLFVLVLLPWVIKTYTPFTKFFAAKADPSMRHLLQTIAYYFRPSMLLSAALAMLLAPGVIGRSRTLYLSCLVIVPMLALAAIGGQLVKTTARYAICTLPVVSLLAGLLMVEVARRVRAWSQSVSADGPGLARPRLGRSMLLAWVLPALVVVDYVRLDVAYFSEQHGQRGRWREAAQFVSEQIEQRGCSGLRILTVNHPTLLYYLRPRHWFETDGDPYPHIEVQAVLRWRFLRGEDRKGNELHEPGVANHIKWHCRGALRSDQLFAVLITLPELREKDVTGEFEALLRSEFELVLHLPCWVGPKDESIYIYMPRAD